MLKLDSKLILNSETIKSPNLTGKFTEADLASIGNHVWAGYNLDKLSRRKWENRTEAAMDLALQIQKDKSFPWPGCSNIAFPLVTIATLQFHSRAYPAIIQNPDVVHCRIIGTDTSGAKKERASRISSHMSWQVLEEDKCWEEQHDRLLINLPCVGTVFTKSFYSPSKLHNVSELVLAKDLVVDYWAKSIEDCPRKTHIIPFFRNDIHERVMRGTFRDVLKEKWYEVPPTPKADTQSLNADNRQGVTTPQTDETTPFTGLEQHVNLDLDKDGYAEPYIITIEESSHCVLRIVTGFDREEDIERVTSGNHKDEIIRIQALQYFTKYSFIPSPDGGFYDVGFGILLGPLNESVNSILNQLVDAGTMQNTAGGFLGRGAKIRGGVYTFAPFQWQRVDSSGDDLRGSIFPLPVRDPSAVMFQLLNLIIGYTERISGSVDTMVGELPGQNTPAETSRNAMTQGLKIYSAIFKRVWRSMKQEFEKLYILNAINLPVRKAFSGEKTVLREDYLGNPDEIAPSADPNVTSDEMNLLQAQLVKQSAMTTSGYDLGEVERRYLKALKVSGIDQIFPGPDKVPPTPNPKVQVENIKLEGKKMQWKLKQADFAAKLMEDQRVNDATIIKLTAEAAALMAGIEGDKESREVNAINAAIGALKTHNDMLVDRIGTILDAIETESNIGQNERGSGTGEAGGRIPVLDIPSGNVKAAEGLAAMAGRAT